MFEEVREVLAKEIGIETQEISLESNLIHDLGIESMDFYCILESMEEKFSVKIPEDKRIVTVKDMVEVLEELKN